MVVLSTMLNRRLTMVLAICIVLPFILVTLSHLGSSDPVPHTIPDLTHNRPPTDQTPSQQQQPPPSNGNNNHKQEWSDIQFKQDQQDQDRSGDKPAEKPTPSAPPRPDPEVSIEDPVAMVRNETLGFGAILLISLKTRTDRQDAVTLIASEAGLKVTHVINAVRGEDIHQKAYPYGLARTELPLPYLGSWRSHMDAFKYIIDNRIETALLLEDDIDWDIYVKEQMTAFSKALRTSPLRKPFTTDELKRAPYGLDWDVMHLGTSKNLMAPPPYNNLFHRYNDRYTTPRSLTYRTTPCGDRDFFCWNDIIKQTQAADDQRIIFPSYQPIGLVALAVSFRGAQKMLYDLSWKGLDASMDFGVRDGCRRGFLKGWSVTPPIMSSWRVKGAGDSDLRNGGKGSPGVGVGNMQGEGIGLGWSARKTMQQQFEGHDYWKDGTIGWFGNQERPVPDNTYVRLEPKEKQLSEHEKGRPRDGTAGQSAHEDPSPPPPPPQQQQQQQQPPSQQQQQPPPQQQQQPPQQQPPQQQQQPPQQQQEPQRQQQQPPQQPPQQEPTKQEPPKQEPPKQEPPKQEPPKQEPPKLDEKPQLVAEMSDDKKSQTLTGDGHFQPPENNQGPQDPPKPVTPSTGPPREEKPVEQPKQQPPNEGENKPTKSDRPVGEDDAFAKRRRRRRWS
ncbi:hypothetical protein TWF718_003622 [Orbilia javanica]|uniref:Glycosyl transferase family 25 domain-containing protein n=1 Tax=Orbilia javanica TaxID=47235 RepID=A0AAN8NA34_9PEZI